jgi:hypothetical protein
MGLFWTFGNHNKGREAAAFLNWATIRNNNYSREAAAFLKATNNHNYGRLFEGKIMNLFWTFGNHKCQLGSRSGRLLELGNNWDQ